MFKKIQALVLLILVLPCLNWWYNSNETVVTQQDIDRLIQINTTFHKYFDKENDKKFIKQFAVLYYGGADVKGSITKCKEKTGDNVFLVELENKFQVNACDYIAVRLIDNTHRDAHTEYIIGESLRTGQHSYNCPKPSGNMYLFTYNSPCDACIARFIRPFMTHCCKKKIDCKEHKLIIGYIEKFRNTEKFNKNIQAIREINHAAIIDLKTSSTPKHDET